MKAYKFIIPLLISINPTMSLGQSLKSQLLALTNKQLFDKALTNGVGSCVITDHRAISEHVCDYYVKTIKHYEGIPYQGLPGVDGVPYGTGCLVAPDAPKGVNTCFDDPNTYPDQPLSICGSSYIDNGANMIRNALNGPEDFCEINSIVPPQPIPGVVGKRLTTMVEHGKIKYKGEKNCVIESATLSRPEDGLPQIYAQTQLSKALCWKLRKQVRRSNPDAKFQPYSESSPAYIVGNMSRKEYMDIRTRHSTNQEYDSVQSIQYGNDTPEQIATKNTTLAAKKISLLSANPDSRATARNKINQKIEREGGSALIQPAQ